MRAAGPRKTPSQRGAARRERIIQSATRFLARNGSRGTSLNEIAAEAGVSQAGLLYHFPTKETLLHAVLDHRDRVEDEILWRDGPDPGLEIFNIVADGVRGWAADPEMVGLVTVLVAENIGDDGPLRTRLASKYQLTKDRVNATLAAAQKRGEIRAEVDTHLKAIEILAFITGLESAWLIDPEIPAAETAAAWAEQQIRMLAP